MAISRLFQESSGEFRGAFVLFQLTFQSFKIFRRVHVVPFRQQNKIQLGLSRSIHRRYHYSAAAPGNVLENSPVKFAHPDQVITAVLGRADDHVVVCLETLKGVEHVFARQRRVVGADDGHGLEAEREEVGETVGQPFAQVFAALRDHQGAFSLDLFESLLFAFGSVAEREDEPLALLFHVFHQRERVAEERDIQPPRLLGTERAQQSGFYLSPAGRFRHQYQCLFQFPSSPRSIRFASSQCPSISSSETSGQALPCSAILFSTCLKRRRNLRFVALSALSGSTPLQRARLATTKRISPISPATASFETPSWAISSRNSRISSSSFNKTSSTFFQSNPTRAALVVNWRASRSAGSFDDTPSSSDFSSSSPPSFLEDFRSAALIASQFASTSAAPVTFSSPNTCGCRRVIFSWTRAID